ncbi:MAG: site-2 protease family protein [Euryarchaeota archaeon]|nr:site-2 protease family protein [Euryarchaeota archaeon]
MIYYARPKFRFYPKEIIDIIIAVGALIFAMSLIMGGSHFVSYLPVATLAVLTGFFIHEMAHKYMAFYYGFIAAFQAWYTGLFIAIVSAFVGFLFAAPGAVVVYGMPPKRENGIISAAGPTMNLILGFSLFAASFFVPLSVAGVLFYVAYFNFFLAFFNLLPIGPMDGTKIIRWNIGVYFGLLIPSIFGVAFPYIVRFL